MNNTNIMFAIPYENIRREQISIDKVAPQGYSRVNCLKITHVEFKGSFPNQDKEDLGSVIIPYEQIPVIAAYLIRVLIEGKNLIEFKHMPAPRSDRLLKAIDDFKSIYYQSADYDFNTTRGDEK